MQNPFNLKTETKIVSIKALIALLLPVAAICLAIFSTMTLAQDRDTIIGFSFEAAKEQRSIEKSFADELRASNLRASLKHITAKPHYTGSPGGQEVAEYILSQFQSWGYDASIETFYGLMSTPVDRVVEMIEPAKYRAALSEPEITDYNQTNDHQLMPPYNVFSSDGDVTAEAVYVNYGLPEDYEFLNQAGISVDGKIAIIRYGKAYRGVKPRLAAENGAVGAIMFSDPADYGSELGETYPDGPFLPDHGYQRGAVSDIGRIAGDPLTPGIGAKSEHQSYDLEDVERIISPIPVLPLSAEDIRPIFREMRGALAPPDWTGGLATTYRLSGPITLRIVVRQDWKIVPLHNVVAKLKGSRWPDEWVLRGNNHDAWNFGAMVPGSGLVAMMEEARAIAELASRGMRPKRTVVYLAWDGEEQGLQGSTEWVETHKGELLSKAVAYLNSGVTTRGVFVAGGSHSLETMVTGVAKNVSHPSNGLSVFEHYVQSLQSPVLDEGASKQNQSHNYRLDPLGLGSDHTPFLQHLGIPSLDFSFDGDAPNGVYHSIYDNFDFYDRFGDPGFVYGVKLAEVYGTTVLRLANAEILPFDYTGMAFALESFADEISLEVGHKSSNTAPSRIENKAEPISVDLKPVYSAIGQLKESAAKFAHARMVFEDAQFALDTSKQRALNRKLKEADLSLANRRGLAGRSWYKHQIYAPDLNTGYGAATLPGIRAAVAERDWETASKEVRRTANLIMKYSKIVNEACRILEQEYFHTYRQSVENSQANSDELQDSNLEICTLN